jgi:ketosteroid isomerase-like protein
MQTPVQFMHVYEKATNTHEFSLVAPLIHPEARFFFREGNFAGKSAIKKAFEKTWRSIKNETYRITHVRELARDADLAVVTYHFAWKGERGGKKVSGRGRGTNTLVRNGIKWAVIGEHLSV